MKMTQDPPNSTNWESCTMRACTAAQECRYWRCHVDGSAAVPPASTSPMSYLSRPVCKTHRCLMDYVEERWLCSLCEEVSELVAIGHAHYDYAGDQDIEELYAVGFS
jgi:hypothetical protein